MTIAIWSDPNGDWDPTTGSRHRSRQVPNQENIFVNYQLVQLLRPERLELVLEVIGADGQGL